MKRVRSESFAHLHGHLAGRRRKGKATTPGVEQLESNLHSIHVQLIVDRFADRECLQESLVRIETRIERMDRQSRNVQSTQFSLAQLALVFAIIAIVQSLLSAFLRSS
jgi:hypothetical protein